jgi:hypothetical protein
VCLKRPNTPYCSSPFLLNPQPINPTHPTPNASNPSKPPQLQTIRHKSSKHTHNQTQVNDSQNLKIPIKSNSQNNTQINSEFVGGYFAKIIPKFSSLFSSLLRQKLLLLLYYYFFFSLTGFLYVCWVWLLLRAPASS